MVLVEVYIPTIEKSYDFQLDEKMTVGEAATEIISIVESSESIKPMENKADLTMCLMDEKLVLPQNIGLSESGIRTGSRIMLL